MIDPETGEPLFNELYNSRDDPQFDFVNESDWYPTSSSEESEEVDEYETSDEY